ncbi:MAG: hypothetical protein LBS38_02745 [Endomicrobium sp.]|jgi:hypothetical protein|nr:hypothetical protein [Endomicrobium sp.]
MRKYNTNFIKTLEKLDKECELNSANRNFAISQIKRAFGLITEKEMLDTIHLFSNLARGIRANFANFWI